MAVNVKKAARFVAVRGSHANIMNESVDLLFDGEDGQAYAIEIDHSIIPAILVAIQGKSSELHATLPQLIDQQPQVLMAVDLEAGTGSDGSLALRVKIEGDLNVDLRYPKAAFRQIEPLIAEILRIVRSS